MFVLLQSLAAALVELVAGLADESWTMESRARHHDESLESQAGSPSDEAHELRPCQQELCRVSLCVCAGQPGRPIRATTTTTTITTTATTSRRGRADKLVAGMMMAPIEWMSSVPPIPGPWKGASNY